ncbi:hypothetical protein STEG23_024427 [Scotinomys teguina]
MLLTAEPSLQSTISVPSQLDSHCSVYVQVNQCGGVKWLSKTLRSAATSSFGTYGSGTTEVAQAWLTTPPRSSLVDGRPNVLPPPPPYTRKDPPRKGFGKSLKMLPSIRYNSMRDTIRDTVHHRQIQSRPSPVPPP